ncbi:hypothetical protein V8C86DRAFT_433301 [Haematococcus lacustris]
MANRLALPSSHKADCYHMPACHIRMPNKPTERLCLVAAQRRPEPIPYRERFDDPPRPRRTSVPTPGTYVTANGIRLPFKPDTSAEESMGKQQASAAPLGLRPRGDLIPVQQSSRDLPAPDIAEPEAAEAALPLPHQQPPIQQQQQQQQQQGQEQQQQGRAAAGRHMPPPLDTRSPAKQRWATAGQAAAPPSTAARPKLEGGNPALFPHSLRAEQQHAALPFQFFATCHPGLEQVGCHTGRPLCPWQLVNWRRPALLHTCQALGHTGSASSSKCPASSQHLGQHRVAWVGHTHTRPTEL